MPRKSLFLSGTKEDATSSRKNRALPFLVKLFCKVAERTKPNFRKKKNICPLSWWKGETEIVQARRNN